MPTPTPTTLFDGSHDSPPPPPGTSGHSEHQQIRSILEQNNWTSRANMRNPAPGNMTQIRAYPSPPHVFETMPLEIEQTRSGEEDIFGLLNFITPPNGAGTPLQIDTTSPHMGRSPAGLQTEVCPAPRLPEHPTYVRRHINRSISATAHAGEESEVIVASGIHGPRALPGVTPACIGKLCDEKPDFRKELLKMLYDKYAQDIWQIMAERGTYSLLLFETINPNK